MQFAPPRPRRRPAENIVPMINVVFLLLIFFLMTAQITPRDPFEVAPPASHSGDSADGHDVLYVSAEGRLAYSGALDEAVFAALATRQLPGPLLLRADASLGAADLARLLPRLAAAGVADVALVTAPVRIGDP